MTSVTINVPNIGEAEGVEVIELCIAVGDTIELEQPLIVLESDKASMEIPSPQAGQVIELLVGEGAELSEGDPILIMEILSAEDVDNIDEERPVEIREHESVEQSDAVVNLVESQVPTEQQVEKIAKSVPSEEQVIYMPDMGGAENIEVIEICAAIGDEFEEGDSLVVVESDKASMEIPAPFAGKIVELLLKESDQVFEGIAIAKIIPTMDVVLDVSDSTVASKVPEAELEDPIQLEEVHASSSTPAIIVPELTVPEKIELNTIYAGPAVRKLARELGVDLNQVKGSGPKSRILKEDVQNFVQNALSKSFSALTTGVESSIPVISDIDFTKFGEIDIQSRSKLHKMTSANVHRSWLNIPHVTQFDDVDVTDLEEFRRQMKAEAQSRDVKLTPLPFLLKACAAALRDNPIFNVSLMADGERIIFKKYINIGIAVATPAGLVVPVVKDVDKKNLWQLAEETANLALKAKNKKLRPDDLNGGCFTISSLGNIGGLGFTPIVNAPEVAILGVSKLTIKPVWDGESFQPREMLPLSLSYDHRAINGGDAGKFFTELGGLLADLRRLLL